MFSGESVENFAMLEKSACFDFLATVSLSLYLFDYAANWKNMEVKISAKVHDTACKITFSAQSQH